MNVLKKIPFLLAFFCLQSVFGQNDFLPKEFHQKKRKELRALMPPKSVAVFFANPTRNRANDVDYHYHQNPDFYYLTGYREANSVLLIFSDEQTDSEGKKYQELIFAQESDPTAEMWNGKRLGKEGVAALGFDKVLLGKDFQDFAINLEKLDRILFFNFKNDIRNESGTADLYDLVESFKTKIAFSESYNHEKTRLYELIRSTDIENSANVAQYVGRVLKNRPELLTDKVLINYQNAENDEVRQKIANEIPENKLDSYSLEGMMNQLRETKSPEELRLLKKAIQISAVGQIETMKAMHPDMSEAEIQGIHEFVYKKYGCEYEGYPSIVGGGNNGCILHYIENNKLKVGKDLVLMDLGAEYRAYTADVTRTIPANGKFTEEQKAIYEVVYQAQEAAIRGCQVGNNFWITNQISKDVINRGLVKLGIIATENEVHNYFPHGTSHYLGLDVHDRGTYGEFKANTVITVEPGIYIPEGSPCDKKWWGIAVRIEDDILITEKGYEILSEAAPRKWEEIEKLMKEKSVLDDFKLPRID